MSAISIVLADDHQLVRRGFRSLLSAEPDFNVIGEAEDGLGITEIVERLQPDVLVLDMVMPGLNGVEVTRQVSRRCPRTRTLILSMYANEAYILAALRHGAAGYVLKTVSPEMLTEAIRTVMTGRRYLCPPLSERAIEAYIQKSEAAELDPYETLTPREREVLQLAAEGHNNTQIGANLAISPRTVESHREKIMVKLGLSSYADLIRFALQRGILPNE